jgi:hypothetical protein
LKNKDDLIYNLIFSDMDDFYIDIDNYIDDINDCDLFVREIKSILKKSKVKIVYNNLSVDDQSIMWNIKVKR